MLTLVLLAFLVVIQLAAAYFTETVVEEKGYHAGSWFLGGLLFGIVALIAAAGLPSKRVREVRLADDEKLMSLLKGN